MRLDYIRGPGAEACPDEQGYRNAVSAQVRWDAFAPNAPWRLTVIVSRSGGGFEGSAELRDITGSVELRRAYPTTARCSDLIADLARAVAVHVDPPAPPTAAPPLGDSPPPIPRTDSLPPPPPAEPTALAFRVGVGTWMDLAVAPRPAFGLSLDVGVRVAWFSIAAEGRIDPPAGATVMDGVDVSTSRFLGALVPCGHVGWFAGCLLGELGQLRGGIGVPGATPDHQAGLFGAAGARLAAEIPVASHLLIRLAADLTGARSAAFTLNGKPLWQTPAFTGGVGAGLLASF
jgi:hypothetical protein